ncbi:MAG TPA: F0F1 ATP synthase subunit A [Armatimonadota bacterium]|nr:F0F1 ATP synthase subunit A [Armatimonadota bacterium]HOJ22476.1 F0F1 ATP synthase subunit A [Armatimonadota bacterium]HOM83431.1 F0F1 ATP synthase subunit A [Armatimonadota bacterium]HPO74142.1 F0F1 ATP synthase subunit A [Armatimonadota bacterium]HPT96823.1 F0F1 ATP synthase subunit A [Armatimonadota bacterium]
MESHFAPWVILLWSGVIIAFLGTISYLGTRKMRPVPGRLQNALEYIVSTLNEFIKGIIGPEGEKHTPFVGTLFLFILFNNLIGLVPGAMAPTSSLNTTVALALITFFYVQYHGIRAHGLVGRLKHLAGPIPAMAPLMLPIEIIGELARPLSLSMRLFGNIFGEEQVIVILAGLAYYVLPFVPIPYQLPMMVFGLFTGFVQALVFTMLACVYISLAAGEAEAH